MNETQNWTFECRVANRNDETDIWNVLVEIAPDIPARVEKLEEQEVIQGLIRECVDGGDTWVAVDSKGTVVGFILARPDGYVRFQEENSALSMPYIGVTKKWQRHGVFTSLLGSLTSRSEPLTAQVLHTNKSKMTENLEKAGFKKENTDSKKIHFRWDPPDVSQTN